MMEFFNWLGQNLQDLLDSFLKLFPGSPIIYLSRTPQISTIISYINWFCPVYLWISILENWLVCILVWYACQIALRWIKAIE